MVKLSVKNSNLCDHNPPTSQTDSTTCDRNTAVCAKVHRAVIIPNNFRMLLPSCTTALVAGRQLSVTMNDAGTKPDPSARRWP